MKKIISIFLLSLFSLSSYAMVYSYNKQGGAIDNYFANDSRWVRLLKSEMEDVGVNQDDLTQVNIIEHEKVEFYTCGEKNALCKDNDKRTPTMFRVICHLDFEGIKNSNLEVSVGLKKMSKHFTHSGSIKNNKEEMESQGRKFCYEAYDMWKK